jgi:DNA-binding NtrC family response regulator
MPYILLIEDDADQRQEMREFFERRGNTVRDVGKIADARQAITERDPDVVVSDINLPDGDGAAFCVEHARRFPRTKWLLISGDPNAAQRTRQLKLDADAPPYSVLNKPVPLRQLDDFVRLAILASTSQPATDIRNGARNPPDLPSK